MVDGSRKWKCQEEHFSRSAGMVYCSLTSLIEPVGKSGMLVYTDRAGSPHAEGIEKTLQDRSQVSNEADTNPETSLGGFTPLRRGRFRHKLTLRPCALGIIGLAIAVLLWGFSYKLSLYRFHPAPTSRVCVAKLWFEQRNSSVAAASRLTSDLRPGSSLPALLIAGQQAPTAMRARRGDFSVACRAFTSINSLIPSRSPPSSPIFLS